MVNHTLDDAVDGVQEVGVLAHGQHSVDLRVQQVVAERDTHTHCIKLNLIQPKESLKLDL